MDTGQKPACGRSAAAGFPLSLQPFVELKSRGAVTKCSPSPRQSCPSVKSFLWQESSRVWEEDSVLMVLQASTKMWLGIWAGFHWKECGRFVFIPIKICIEYFVRSSRPISRTCGQREAMGVSYAEATLVTL